MEKFSSDDEIIDNIQQRARMNTNTRSRGHQADMRNPMQPPATHTQRSNRANNDNKTSLPSIEEPRAKSASNNQRTIDNDAQDVKIDYYKIIGCDPSMTQKYVIEKCNEMLAKYHPDKIISKIRQYPMEERARQKTRFDTQYNLIREASKILKDPAKRKYYDIQRKAAESQSGADFISHRAAFEEYKRNYMKQQAPEDNTDDLNDSGDEDAQSTNEYVNDEDIQNIMNASDIDEPEDDFVPAPAPKKITRKSDPKEHVQQVSTKEHMQPVSTRVSKKSTNSQPFVPTIEQITYTPSLNRDDTIATSDPKKVAKRQKEDYKTKAAQRDKKHGITDSALSGDKIETADFNRRIDDIALERTTQDAELAPRKRFDAHTFNPTDFNKYWELTKLKKERKRKHNNTEDNSIIKWDGVAAYGDQGTYGAEYMTIDNNDNDDDEPYEKLYAPDDKKDYKYATTFGSDNDDSSSNSNDDDDINIDAIDVSYVTKHNSEEDKKNFKKSFKDLLIQRQREIDETAPFTANNTDLAENPFNIEATRIKNEANKGHINTKLSKEKIEAYKALTYNEHEFPRRK